MPCNRKKDYSIRSTDNVLISINDYRQVPWQQTYAGRTYDFRRWLYVGRPELADDGSSLSDKNGNVGALIHAGRDVMVEIFCCSVWQIPSVEAITKDNYCQIGLTYWFEYLDYRYAAKPVYELTDIGMEVIQGFIHWLKFTKEAATENGRLSLVSVKTIYAKIKPLFQYLIRQGTLPDGIFPRNPFPNINRAYVGHKPYDKKVMTSLMAALYTDIKSTREGLLQLIESEILSLYLLAIAARTGRNTTPLLELTRDAVMPHPIKPDKMGLLITYKRRGRTTSVQAFERPRPIEDMISLPMDALTLYREAVSMSASLIDEAPHNRRNHLWLYRKASSVSGQKVVPLSDAVLSFAASKLVKRHGLIENGKPLKLNISRLRKTFAQRIWHFTGGDLLATAEQLGNTPAVAGNSYVATTPEMVANFRRLGILMYADWAGKLDDIAYLEELSSETGIPADSLKDIAVGYNNTGVGRCTDPRYGVKAPRDGSLCTKWLECFRCPNQLVLEADLYRLFSFYFLLVKERNYISREKWDSLYAPIIQIIDKEIIAPNLRTKENPKGCFDPFRVNKARAEAEAKPHRMWQDRAILGNMT